MNNIGRRKAEIFCHFSFRRPKNKDYGYFAVAFYMDFDGKVLIKKSVRQLKLWENHQFISAIQSYENALSYIHENQRLMRDAGIVRVFLVTDNSTLAGWIMNPKKNRDYTELMHKASRMYATGAPKEIVLDVGLCEPRDYEKSYKFCKECFVNNEVIQSSSNSSVAVQPIAIKIDEQPKFINDIINDDKSIPDYSGSSEIL